MAKRPPIIVIIGSVDHGKTTLLDYIRKTNVAAKEAGGITQSVGAYEIEHEGRKITFIDTPGHEAFSKMKARGAKIADIAVLVVAADDGVQPQTKEAIKIIKESETPFVVAINKIDKVPDTSKVKNELMQAGVLLEGYGGDISNQPVSAKTGEGMNDLLDLILLAADMEHLDYDPSHLGKGFVLEATLDSRRGPLATVIVTDGTIRRGDSIRTNEAFGKIKILENFLGKTIMEATASSPLRILGFETIPKVGEDFIAGPKLEPDISTKASPTKIKGPKTAAPEGQETIRLILKADTSGSLEALSEIIKNLPHKESQNIEIAEEAVGNIGDGDVKLAISTKATIIGFKTSASKAAETLARAHGVRLVQSKIVYELLKAIEETLESLHKKIIKGKLEILAVFSKKGTQQIIGGKVTEGAIVNNAVLEIQRKNDIIGSGKVLNLQQQKRDAKTVGAGNECGLLFDAKDEIKTGDVLILRQ